MSLKAYIILTLASFLLFAGPMILGMSLLRYGYDLPWVAWIAGVGGIALSVSLVWLGQHLVALRRKRRRQNQRF